MAKVTQRLTREDWILAGFRALSTSGTTALRVEPVARVLGTTKGSLPATPGGQDKMRHGAALATPARRQGTEQNATLHRQTNARAVPRPGTHMLRGAS